MARTVLFTSCLAACLALGASVGYAQRAQNPITQPLRDIGLLREHVPDVLQRAVNSPYAVPHSDAISTNADCETIATEIAALDDELGPDVDVHTEHHMTASGLLAGAVRSALRLPYGSIIRQITGEAHREQMMQAAVRAGTARRAFLKGLRVAECTTASPAPLTPATTQVDDVTPQPLPPDVLQASAEAPDPALLSPAAALPLTQIAAVEPVPEAAAPLPSSAQAIAVSDTAASP